MQWALLLKADALKQEENGNPSRFDQLWWLEDGKDPDVSVSPRMEQGQAGDRVTDAGGE